MATYKRRIPVHNLNLHQSTHPNQKHPNTNQSTHNVLQLQRALQGHWPIPLRQGYRCRDRRQLDWCHLLDSVWPAGTRCKFLSSIDVSTSYLFVSSRLVRQKSRLRRPRDTSREPPTASRARKTRSSVPSLAMPLNRPRGMSTHVQRTCLFTDNVYSNAQQQKGQTKQEINKNFS